MIIYPVGEPEWNIPNETFGNQKYRDKISRYLVVNCVGRIRDDFMLKENKCRQSCAHLMDDFYSRKESYE